MKDDIGTLIEPQPVDFTWGAPGWYVIGSIVILLILILIVLLYRHYQKNKYRASAVLWLEQREAQMLARHPIALIYDAAILMKRLAVTRYGRTGVAGIQDKAWLSFLNQTCKRQLFDDRDFDWLHNALYASQEDVQERDIRLFITKTKTWIKHHRYAL
jgi:hypothetical protein